MRQDSAMNCGVEHTVPINAQSESVLPETSSDQSKKLKNKEDQLVFCGL